MSYQEEGRKAARDANPLHLAGCMLYRAEGARARNQVKFTISDLRMLRVFRDFLIDCIQVDIARLRLTLNVYTNNGLSIEPIEKRWLTEPELPSSCVRKHALNHTPSLSSGERRGVSRMAFALSRSCCTRLVQHIYGAIQEYGGFDEPSWLDGAYWPARHNWGRAVSSMAERGTST
jgi:hypothetical protein